MCASYFVNLNNNTFQLKTLLFFVRLRSQQKRTEKVISSYFWGIPSSREICWVERCVWGWFSWLCTRSPTVSTFSAVHVVRGRPLQGARSMDPVVRNRFW